MDMRRRAVPQTPIAQNHPHLGVNAFTCFDHQPSQEMRGARGRYKKKNGQRAGMPPGISAKWGYTQNAPAERAPTCPSFTFNSDALASCAQAMPSTRKFCFFWHVVAASGTVAHEGSKGSPLLTPGWGVCPRNSTKFV